MPHVLLVLGDGMHSLVRWDLSPHEQHPELIGQHSSSLRGGCLHSPWTQPIWIPCICSETTLVTLSGLWAVVTGLPFLSAICDRLPTHRKQTHVIPLLALFGWSPFPNSQDLGADITDFHLFLQIFSHSQDLFLRSPEPLLSSGSSPHIPRPQREG